ncbi:MAG: nucleoside triphosphate pyrophosphohydrolase [Firmicutes bacterium]|nr:nucleoside triphosphate pyrophosphohydrolase [Bacillota bacterium]
MKKIYLVGLGPGNPQAITRQSLFMLKQIKHVYLRTVRHPGVKVLRDHHISFKPLDFFYKRGETFSEVYRQIAYFVLNAALHFGTVAYVVPGSPLFAEKAVEIIMEKAGAVGVECRVLPAVSFLEAVTAELQLPREKELLVLDALETDKLLSAPDKNLLIMQAYNDRIASTVKLELLKLYPPEHPITLLRGAGLPRNKRIATVPLYQIDRQHWIDHLTTLYVPPLTRYNISDLLQVMRILRSEHGCPWDQEQDHISLKPYLLEEAYEVLEAIDKGDKENFCEELGDLLLQIVFHSEIAAESQDFTFYDVIERITEKLKRRHPHVFGNKEAKTAAEVLRTWEQIKKEEKKERTSLFTVETYLPALLRAQKLQRQASSVGFDWPEIKGAWEKLQEELIELKDAYNKGNAAKIEEELGDLLFAVVNVARFLDVDAEQALAAAINKFFQRLRFVEEQVQAEGGEMSDYSLEKLDEWWNLAKNQLKG